MTAAEYARAYAAARREIPSLTLGTMRRLRKTYLEAAEMAAAKMRAAELLEGGGGLTASSWAQMEEALRAGAQKIQLAIEAQLPLAVKDIAGEVTQIDEVYLVEALNRAGVDLDRAVVKNLFVDASDKVIRSLVTRVYSDGYTFSQRVWRAGLGYQESMKRAITSGISSGRDILDVARDLQVYAREGRDALAKRWGDLTRGTPEWTRRIRVDVSSDALRLVRSELYSSEQEAARIDGMLNPGCSGLFDWVRTLGGDWDCDCPELAAGSPYTAEELPAYPHPQCACIIRPRLRDPREFIRDLKVWAGGERVGYLDAWHDGAYRLAA